MRKFRISEKNGRTIMSVSAIAIIVLYVIGIVLLFFGQTARGVELWVVSTLLGGAFLFAKSRREQIKADTEELERELAERNNQGKDKGND